MSDNPPILTGKRKRAAVSYAEPDDVLELQSDEELKELSIQAQSTDSDDDETFGARRKVRHWDFRHYEVALLTP